jgi:hypothetical protein
MKKILVASLLTISALAFAAPPTAFTFVAPASVAVAPALTNLLGVVNAFKAVGTAFALADPVATGLLDQAAINLTLSNFSCIFKCLGSNGYCWLRYGC